MELTACLFLDVLLYTLIIVTVFFIPTLAWYFINYVNYIYTRDIRPNIIFKIEDHHAKEPVRATKGSVGFDLFSVENKIVKAHDRTLVSIGLSAKIPIGYYGRIAPRSSLAVKNFIDIGAGVIDPDYRGVIKVVMFNFSDQDFEVSIGDKIAQMIIERVCTIDRVVLISSGMELDDGTDRGSRGFGSTGMK